MNILLAVLGFLVYWLMKFADKKANNNHSFVWCLADNWIRILISALTVSAFYFIIDATVTEGEGLLPDIKYINIVRALYFFAAYFAPSLINRVSNITTAPPQV